MIAVFGDGTRTVTKSYLSLEQVARGARKAAREEGLLLQEVKGAPKRFAGLELAIVAELLARGAA